MKVPAGVAASVLCLPVLLAAAGDVAPPTRRAPSRTATTGSRVVDDYRWLEDAASPEVVAWTEAQNRYTRAVLDALPGSRRASPSREGDPDDRGPPLRRVEDGGRAPLRPALPPAAAAAGARGAAVGGPAGRSPRPRGPEPDRPLGRDLHGLVRALARRAPGRGVAGAGRLGAGRRARVRRGLGPAARRRRSRASTTGRPAAAWPGTHAGEGFYYTRYPRKGERPEADLDFYVQVYYHRLGTPESHDRYEIGKDFPRIAEIELRARPDGRYLLANVQNGDGGEFEQHLRREDGSWTRLSRFADRVLEAVFDPDDESLLLLSRAGAPRGRLLRLALRPSGPLDPPRPFLPEGEAVIESSFSWDADVEDRAERESPLPRRADGRARARAGPRSRRPGARERTSPRGERGVPGPAGARPGRAPGAERLLRGAHDLVPLRAAGAGSAGRLTKTGLSVEFPISLRDATVSREWAVSKDGTRVPLTVIAPKGAPRDGTSPTLLTATAATA